MGITGNIIHAITLMTPSYDKAETLDLTVDDLDHVHGHSYPDAEVPWYKAITDDYSSCLWQC